MNQGRISSLCLTAAFAALAVTPGCKPNDGAPGLSKADDDRVFAHVPVPAADGPKLFALTSGVEVMDKPGGAKIGELGAGSAVARSPMPYSKTSCEGGWFAVRPRGFVCADFSRVTVDPAIGKLAAPPPDITKALPYRYGRARTENVPIYARIPTNDEQAAAEPDLSRHLSRGEEKEPLGAAANDVPLDQKLSASGPPVLLPTGDGMKDGKRTGATYFVFANESLSPIVNPKVDVKAGALRKNSVVAVAGSFSIDGAAAPRRFGVTSDGKLVPVDRLKPALGSTWHGLDLEGVGLPVAFIHKLGVHPYTLEHGKALKHDDELDRKAAFPMSGKFRTVEGVRYEETRDGQWLRSQDLITVVKRTKMPDFASGNQKWLDISIANETLTAYEGKKPVYVTLISAGRDQLKDPATSASTPRGAFRVKRKAVSAPQDTKEVQNGFDIADAPYVMDIDGGSLFGMVWSDTLGEATTYHGVGMAPIDAHRVWSWADPQLPEGWSAVMDDAAEATTMINVRP